MAPRTRAKDSAAETEAQVPQVTPSATGYPGRDFDYTLQCVFELQKSFGAIDTKLDNMKSSIDGLKTKVDDLVGWKQKIIGGAAVLGAVIALLAFFAGKASEYVTFKQPAAQAVAAPPANNAPVATPAAQPVTPKSP